MLTYTDELGNEVIVDSLENAEDEDRFYAEVEKMERFEDLATHIKETFEDIEQYNLNKVLYCEDCNNDEKYESLNELKDKLVLLIEDIDKII